MSGGNLSVLVDKYGFIREKNGGTQKGHYSIILREDEEEKRGKNM
jgi:hypothetical protein